MAKALKIVVVGGVAAGPKAAARARRLNPEAEITILERGRYISYSACGLPYVISGEVPELESLMATPVGVMRDAEYFKNVKGILFLTGKEAVGIDRARKVVAARDLATGQEETYPYDRLVLATGASPVRPAWPGIDVANVFVLRQPRDAVAIMAALQSTKPRQAALVGSGPIGLEMAEAFRQWGLEVLVIEALDQVLSGALDREMATLLHRHLESKGVAVRLGERVTSLAAGEDGRVARLYTDQGEYAADLVVVAIGVRPNVELARQAGLELGATGAIKVDQYLCTSDPDIYAGGDCAENFHRLLGRAVFVSSGQLANVHGRIIGTNVVGGREACQGIVGTMVARVFDWTVGATGLTEAAARREGLQVTTALMPGLDRDPYLPGALFLGLKMVAEMGTGRLLGVQVAGPGDGAKRLDAAAAALTLGATVAQLSQLNQGYSPPYAPAIDILVSAAQVLANKLAGVAKSISTAEVMALTAAGEDFLLLDVRTPPEFREGGLTHPRVFAMPLEVLRRKAPAFPKDRLYITFCRFGPRAYEAQRILEGLGFPQVRFLEGGMVFWPDGPEG